MLPRIRHVASPPITTADLLGSEPAQPARGAAAKVAIQRASRPGSAKPCALARRLGHRGRARRHRESAFGFGARPARRYDDGVLMLYNAAGFALALGRSEEPIVRPSWMHFGIGLPHRDAVLALRDRLSADGIELVEEWDESDYVSVKCRDPDGYIVEAAWEPEV
jgi:hypothetical protein